MSATDLLINDTSCFNIFSDAVWIWKKDHDAPNSYVRFMEKLPKAEGNCIFRISVDSDYALYINDELVSFGQYPDYPFDKCYDEIDVSACLTKRENTIRIDCYHQGEDSSTLRNETAGMICELLKDGVPILSSREAMLSAPIDAYACGASVEKITNQLGYSFSYDSAKKAAPFTPSDIMVKEKPRRLRPVKKLTLGDPLPTRLTATGEFTENGGETAAERMQRAFLRAEAPDPVPLLTPDGGSVDLRADGKHRGIFTLIDTGCENVGLLSLDITLFEECDVLIGWGEHLDDLRLRTFVGGRHFAAVYHGKAGRNRFFHPFRRLGLRYLALMICSDRAVLHYAGIRPTEYPLSYEAPFPGKDLLHKKIYDTGLRTLKLCMHDHYEDCPWREQALYTMDSRNQMLCGYEAFHEYDFPKASLRLIAESLRDDHLLELCSPARVRITIPSFSAVFLTECYEYLAYSKDTDFTRSLLPVLREIADGFIRRTENDRGLIRCFAEENYWNFYEWSDGLSGSIEGDVPEELLTCDAPLNAFVSAGLRDLSLLCGLLGETEAAAYYLEEHRTLNRAMAVFWSENDRAYASFLDKKGELRHYAELTNSLFIFADAVPDDKLPAVLSALTEKRLQPVTLSHSIYKYDAILKHAPDCRDFVFGEIADIWGGMLFDGATAFYETEKGAADFENAGSLCHGWSAIPVWLYHKYLCPSAPRRI